MMYEVNETEAVVYVCATLKSNLKRDVDLYLNAMDGSALG